MRCMVFLAKPDIISFGKKTQVCGVAASTRFDEVDGNVFRESSVELILPGAEAW